MQIKISELWMTQRNLSRREQIPAMIRDLKESQNIFPSIEIFELEDGSLEINNGHHRCMALYIGGTEYLEYGEYVLIQVNSSQKRRYWKIQDSPIIPVLQNSTQ